VAGAAPAQVHIAFDPAARRGVLPNGLRYIILHNAKPQGRGFAAPGNRRRGLGGRRRRTRLRPLRRAHGLQRDRPFREDKIGAVFAAKGVDFGRDLNAFTGVQNTFYQLNLPKADPESLDTGLSWLRDVADGMAFSEDAVTRERGVILAEDEARNSVAAIANRLVEQFQAPELRSVQRDPSGDSAVVKAATGVRLRAFYERWYRPEHAVLIVVGDVAESEIEARVKTVFGDWRGKGVGGVRPAGAALVSRGLEAFVHADARLPTSLSACQFRKPDSAPAGSFEAYRGVMLSRLWLMVLNRRLASRAEEADSGLFSAGAYQDLVMRDVTKTCLSVSPSRDAWELATASAQAVLQAFEAQGPSERELEQAIAEVRAGKRGNVSGARTRLSAAVADTVLQYDLAGDTYAAPLEEIRVFDRAVEDLTPALVLARFRQDWAGSGPRLALITPTAPPPAKVAEGWRAANARPVVAHVDRETSPWAYREFGPKGTVAKREVFTDPGFVRVRFGNGVVLNFKKTDYQHDQAGIRVRFGAGRQEIADADYYAGLFGAALFQSGGLRRHSADELDTLFRNIDWGADLSVREGAFVLSGLSSTGSIGRELEVLAAFATDPGFRPDLDRRLPTSVEQYYRAARTAPASVAADALMRSVAPTSPQLLPSKDALLRMTAHDFDRVFRPALTQAPMEVTIVGDIEEKTVTEMVARTFGALPRRTVKPRARKDIWFLRFPDGPVAPVNVGHEGPGDQAVTMMEWPLFVGGPSRRREEYALHLLAGVFANGLRQRVREELGKTYAPDAGLVMTDDTDQGRLVATLETRPEDMQQAVAEARTVAARLVRGEINEAELETVRNPLLASVRADQSGNDWWLAALDGSAADPGFLHELQQFEATMESITLAEVRAAAAKWLAAEPFTASAVPAADTRQAGRP
jgi:zinc protease